MKEFTITGKDDGRRLDKWMLAEMPLLSPACGKDLRLKRVRINGKVAARDARLATGDVLNIYLNDELFEKPHRTDALLSKFHWHLNIVYEDENILLVDKRPGIMVHGDAAKSYGCTSRMYARTCIRKANTIRWSKARLRPRPATASTALPAA